MLPRRRGRRVILLHKLLSSDKW